MDILFLSSLIPDKPEYINQAFSRSGNNVLMGIADSLYKSNYSVDCISYRPTPSYPRAPIFIKKEVTNLASGLQIQILPTVNIKAFKNLCEGLGCFQVIKKWKKRHKGDDCRVLVYNIYDPPLPFLYYACKLYDIKLYCIFYDLGVPPKNLNLSRITMVSYKVSELFVSRYMKKIDGRIIINESIINHYAPNSDFLLIDGGVNDVVVSKLFPLSVSEKKEYVFVCAGMLWQQNGTRLLLDALKITSNPDIRIVFAGKGNDEELIKNAAKNDSRISYKGMLSMDQLFEEYDKADVLMNLRIEEIIDFHFPSKLLEYLVMGKLVLSTEIAHARRDYGNYMCFLKEISPECLATTMESIMKIPKQILYERGVKAREFMLNNRTWNCRTKKILDYILKS